MSIQFFTFLIVILQSLCCTKLFYSNVKTFYNKLIKDLSKYEKNDENEKNNKPSLFIKKVLNFYFIYTTNIL